jgi:hypothetical protein
MGTDYRYVFVFRENQKEDFEELRQILEKEQVLEDTDEYCDGGYLEVVMRQRDIKEYLKEIGFKGKCSIECTNTQPEPDEIVRYNGDDKNE